MGKQLHTHMKSGKNTLLVGILYASSSSSSHHGISRRIASHVWVDDRRRIHRIDGTGSRHHSDGCRGKMLVGNIILQLSALCFKLSTCGVSVGIRCCAWWCFMLLPMLCDCFVLRLCAFRLRIVSPLVLVELNS